MGRYIINGGKQLSGIIEVSGAKNSALPILMSTLIAKGDYKIKNIPVLKDVDTSLQLLKSMGLDFTHINNEVIIKNNNDKTTEAPYDLANKMRASFWVMGPLLARFGEGKVSLPGGCAIGTRPVDLHLKGFEKLGAKIKMEHGYVHAKADKLKGAKINLDFPSVGATINLIMASVLAEGETTINNSAHEPEVVDLANFLQSMGANIVGAGTDKIKIIGVKELKPNEYEIIPDRIEAGTFIILSLLFGGQIKIKNVNIDHLGEFIKILEKMGVGFLYENKVLSVSGDLKKLKHSKVVTKPFPGFATDLQAQMMTLFSLISGKSEIKETIFENRFMHVNELCRMGANIKVEGNKASIIGPCQFSGAEVSATDLRAGASLVLAGLVATGITTINEVQHIERGYEKLVERLQKLGAIIRKED